MKLRSNLKTVIENSENPNLSLRQLARDIDYRFESVRQMHKDKLERYPKDLLLKLCEYFNVPISKLLILVED